MTPCKKCGKKFGLMIEEDDEIMCINCHPTAISNLLSPNEIFQKIQHMNIFKSFKRTIEE
jgi:hypothetical protein